MLRLPMVLLLSAATTFGGSFTADFSGTNTPGYTLNQLQDLSGATYPLVTNGQLVLLYNETHLGPVSMVVNELDNGAAIDSFTANFQMQLGPASSLPADGVCFAFGPDIGSGSVFGQEGPYMPSGGVCVCFDTYDNGYPDHVGVDVKVKGDGSATNGIVNGGSVTLTSAAMVDSQMRNVMIQVTRNGLLNMAWGNQVLFTNLYLGGWVPTQGRFGLGASSGAWSEQVLLNNLSIATTVEPAPALAPSVTAPPQSVTVHEGFSAAFSVGFDGDAPITLQWTQNGVPLLNETNLALTLAQVSYAANNAQIACIVAGGSNAVTSQAATLTVVKDTTPPTVTNAVTDGTFANVVLSFDKPVSATALNVSNYAVDQGVTVLSVTRVDAANVTLSTSKLPVAGLFTLTINGVQDLAATPNTIATNTQVQFRSYVYLGGAVLHKKYSNCPDDYTIGDFFNDPRYPNHPDRVDAETTWEYPADDVGRVAADPARNYYDTLEGYFIPPATANYVFFICGDDEYYLYLSTDDSPANLKQIGAEPGGWSDNRNWTQVHQGGDATTERSDQNAGSLWPGGKVIALNAGQRYYMIALHHDHSWSGSDWFGVTYKKDTDPDPAAYSASTLAGSVVGDYFDPAGALAIAAQPQSQLAVAGTNAAFSVAVNGAQSIYYQWRLNGANLADGPGVAGSLSAKLGLTNVQTNEAGDYSVVVRNAYGAITSAPATLTVEQVLGGGASPVFVGQDVGAPTHRGWTTANAAGTGSFTINGGGDDIWNHADNCFYYYAWASGAQWDAVVEVTDMAGGDGFWAKCELMVRQANPVNGPQGDDPFIAQVMTQPTGANGLTDQWRSSRGAMADGDTAVNFAPGSFPQWLKISRNGSVFSLYHGTDGANWTKTLDLDTAATTPVGSYSGTHFGSAWPELVAVGIAVTAHNDNATDGVTASVDNFHVTFPFTPLPPTTMGAAIQPQNATNSADGEFSFAFLATNNASPNVLQFPEFVSYQWYKNGAALVGATSTAYTFLGTMADNGAQVWCVAALKAPWNTNIASLTSATGSVTVLASTVLTGALKQEYFPNALRLDVEAGNVGPASSITAVPSLDLPGGLGVNYVTRTSGFFMPRATDNYVFFVACDEDSDFFLSTDQSPANKRLIAQETGWSAMDAWLTSVSGGSYDACQKRSDQWVPDPLNPPPGGAPYKNGIPLSAGSLYYMELVHHQSTGLDPFGVTFQTMSQVGATNWAAVFTNGTPGLLQGTNENHNIGLLTMPATYIAWVSQPTNAAIAQGGDAAFQAQAVSDSEFTPVYQWYKNGAVISNGTGALLSLAQPDIGESGSTYFVVAAPFWGGYAITSSVVSLTIQHSVWEPGWVRMDLWWSQYSGLSPLLGGPLGAPDITEAVAAFESATNNEEGDDYNNRLSGFFTPPGNGSYVFFINSDDFSELFLSTDNTVANKRLVAQETSWSGPWQWTTDQGGSATQKRSDAWSPDGGVTIPYAGGIPLIAGRKYYLEADHNEGSGGDNVEVTFKKVGDPDPALGADSALQGNLIGMYAPRSRISVSQAPTNITAFAYSYALLTVSATTDSKIAIGAPGDARPYAGNFLMYRWMKNGVAIPGATGNPLFLDTIMPADNGAQFSVQLRSMGYSDDSLNPIWTNLPPATLTVVQPQVVTFLDPQLEAAVRAALAIPTADITPDQMTNLTSLSVSGAGVTNLAALGWATNLVSLDLSGNGLTSIAALANCTAMQNLHLGGNQLTDVSALAGLTKLVNVELLNNQITQIESMAGLTNLLYLNVGANRLTNVLALAACANLQSLYLYGNQLADVGALAGLTNLLYLNLSGNQISEIGPLAHLTRLVLLDVGGNQLTDVNALGGLTNLNNLGLYDNQIAQIGSLASLTKMMYLNLGANQLTDVSALGGLTNLVNLGLYGNQISQLGPLAGLINITYLNLAANQLTDVSALGGLTNLVYLELYGNQIARVDSLAACRKLGTLDLFSNHLSDLAPLAGLTNLTQLTLNNNWIMDLSPLIGLTSAAYVSVQWNYLDLSSGSAAQTVIAAWQARGVKVNFQGQNAMPQITITWTNPAPIVYGTALGTNQLNAIASVPGLFSSVPGSFAYTPTNGTVLNVGTNILSVLFIPSGSSTVVKASVPLWVLPATPTVTWANPAPIFYGAALGTNQLNATASVPGSFIYQPSSGMVLNVGSNILSVQFTPFDATDYRSLSRTVSLLVLPTSGTVIATNPSPITINDFAAATPYPSSIQVGGLSGWITDVGVTLNEFSHASPSDVSILLVAPSGQPIVLMSRAGGGMAVSNAFISFDVNATNPLPQSAPITSGLYEPTDYQTVDTFFSPAPAGPYAKTLGLLEGANPNGTWSLYVQDDVKGNDGQISGGWTLYVQTGGLSISAIPAQTISENGSLTVPFTVSSAGGNPASLTVTATSSQNSPSGLIGNLLVSGPDSNGACALVINPAANLPSSVTNGNGTAQVTVSVSNGTTVNSTTFPLTVTFVDQPPTIAPLANQFTPANTPLVAPLTVSDVDTPISSLALSVTSANPALGSFGILSKGTNLALQFTPSGTTGVSTVTVKVSDGYFAASASFVLSVGVAPSITAQPQSQTNVAGTTATFAVTATGTAPMGYQWQFNGANLSRNIMTVAGGGSLSPFSTSVLATSAGLDLPCALAFDRQGNLFIADNALCSIVRLGTNGMLSWVAGTGARAYSGDGGQATSAAFSLPGGVAVDSHGNVFIADSANHRIRKVDTNGIITTAAGNGVAAYSGDGGQATNASVYGPGSLAIDAWDNLFISDGSYRIRRVDASGFIATVAGGGAAFPGDGGLATNAQLMRPSGIAVDDYGNLFIADRDNHRVRKVGADGILTTVAGTGTSGFSGDGGPATNATLLFPSGVAVDGLGNIFIADSSNERIRVVGTDGIISTLAGNGVAGFSGDGGPAISAALSFPDGLAVDASGNLFIAEVGNNRVRELPAEGPTLVLQHVSAANGGDYQVIVTDPYGVVTSAPPAVLTVQPFILAVLPANVLQPTDAIIASSTNSPGSEGAANAIDGTQAKYLNLDSATGSSGFIVTPAVGATVAQGLAMESANDAPERDPKEVTLEGSNDDIANYTVGTWTQIVDLQLPAFTNRFETQTFVFNNVTPYKHYRWTVAQCQGPNQNSMQIAEVEILGTTAPANVLQPTDAIIASSTNSPGSEGAANAIDGTQAKYLNVDSAIGTSGFVVTPSVGATTVTGLGMESANDAPERDPKEVTIEGSNDDTANYSVGTWTMIVDLQVPAFTNRYEWQYCYFPNVTAYKHYRWTVLQCQGPYQNSMQVAEVQLLAVTSQADCSKAAFVSAPVETPVLNGAQAEFFTAVNGPWPLQWLTNGAPVPGANQATFTTDPISAANASITYSVAIVGCQTSPPVRAVIFTPSTTASIGVHFVGGGANGAPTYTLPNDIAGVQPQAYWINATNTNGRTGDGANLPDSMNDSSNNPSAITFEYHTSGTWGAGVGSGQPAQRMLNGLVGARNPGNGEQDLIFHNVPAGSHAVLLYSVSPPLQFQDVSFAITNQGMMVYQRTLSADEYKLAPGFYRSTSTDPNNPSIGDFVRFDGVHPDVNGDVVVSFNVLTVGVNPTGVNAIQLALNTPNSGTLFWSNPSPVVYGMPLGTNQLNASASVPGTFAYTPAIGALLHAGTNNLSVAFTPSGGSNILAANVALVVLPATPALTWANPAPMVYGASLGTNQLNATASAPGSFAYAPTNGAVLGAGTNFLSVVFTPTDTIDYRSLTGGVSLVVLPATPTLAWANPAPMAYGASLGTNQLNATASVPGSFAYAPAAGTALTVGTNTVSVVFTPADAMNYRSVTGSVSVVVLPAGEAVFANANLITINDNAPATPYPSLIQVSGVSGTIVDVSVTLNGFAHTYSSDVSLLLVSPTGQQIVLMSRTGGGSSVTNASLTFNDAGTSPLPQTVAITSGVYRPTDYKTVDTFFPAAPAGPYAKTLSVLDGLNPNGVWSLYGQDDVQGDAGQISGGWTLTLQTGGVSISAIAAQTVSENGTLTVPFTVSAVGANPTNLVVAASASQTTPSGLISALVVSGPDVNGVCALAISPAANLPSLVTNGNGTAQITLTVSNGNFVSSTTFPLTVAYVDQLPMITGLSNQTTLANAPLSVPFTVGDIDTPVANLTVSATSDNPALGSIGLSSNGASQTLQFTPNGTGGSATVSVSVSDGILTTTANFALTVVSATPALTWANPAPVSYGAPLGTNQLNATANVPGSFAYTPANGAVLNVGTNLLSVIFTPSGGGSSNALTASVALVVLPATPAITWVNPAPMVHGAALGTNQLNATASVPGSFSYAPTNGAVLNVGTNTLSALFTPTDTIHYRSLTANVSLLVLPTTPTLTWANPAPLLYGAALGSNQLNATASAPGTFAYTPTNGAVLNVGTNFLSVVFTPTDAINYRSVTGSVSLVVLPATPTLAWANPAPMVYGAPLGTNQLNATANVPGSFAYAPTNGAVLNAGTNFLSVVFTPTDTADYRSLTGGVSLVVLPATPTLTWANPAPMVYGAPLGTNQLNATASSPGSFAYAPTNGAVLGVGTNFLSVVFTPTDTADYRSLTGGVSLVVLPATPTLAWANPAPMAYSASLGTNQLNATASVPGSFAYAPAAGTALTVGTNTLSVVFTPADAMDYRSVTGSVSVVVLPAGEAVFANANLITINDNAPATPYPSLIQVSGVSGTIVDVSVTLDGLSHTYPSDVSLLLVSPTGQQIVLMSRTGGGSGVTNASLTFDAAGTNFLPQSAAITSGVYQPTDYKTVDTFFPAAPAGPYAKTLSVLDGLNPNGVWSLYAQDDVQGDAGVISGGWTLGIQATGLSISAIGAQAMSENGTLTVPFTVGSVGANPTNLVVTASLSQINPSGLINGLVVSGPDANGVCALAISPAANLPSSVTNGNGTAQITVTVSNGTFANSTTFPLTVTYADQAPTITGLSNQSTVANAPLSVPFTVADIDTPVANLTVSATSDNPALGSIVLTSNGASQTLQFTPNGTGGSATVSVSVSDGILTTTANFVLTVAPVTPALAWANPAPVVYGAPLGTKQLNATANVPGSFAYSPANGAGLNAGTNLLSVIFTPSGGASSNALTASVALVVLPAPLNVTANNWTQFYGAAIPLLTGTITGLLNGDNITATYSCAATSASLPGAYSILPSLVDPNSRQANYTVSLVNGALTVVSRPNTAPVLVTLTDQTVNANSLLSFQVSATDTDAPPQTLIFSLGSGAPSGASMAPGGLFAWTPTAAQAPATNLITVTVSDNGTPPLSTSGSFTVVVQPENQTIDGLAHDGYLAGSTVFFDANLNGILDPGEPFTQTDQNGHFNLPVDLAKFDLNHNGVLDPAEGRLVVTAGIDIATGLPLGTIMTAPANSTVVNPLTTLMQTVLQQNPGMTATQAQATVKGALGITNQVDLTQYDPLAGSVTNDPAAISVLSAAAQVQDTVVQVAALVSSAANNPSSADASATVMAQLAANAQAGGGLNLGTAAGISSLITQSMATSGTQVSSEVTAGAASVISGANQLSDSLAANATDSSAAAQLIVQVQVVAQGNSAQSLQDVGNGSQAIDDVVTAYTGAGLSQAVTSAPVGDVTGTEVRSGTFAFSQAAFSVNQYGVSAPGSQVTVIRTDGNSGAVSVRVRLSTGTATTQGVDFSPGPIVVAFGDNEISKNVDLSANLMVNPQIQAGATINLSLSLDSGSPAGASLGSQASAVVSLISVSSPGIFSFSADNYSVHESGTPVAPVVVTRTGGSAGRVTVVVTPSEIPGGAVAGRDFIAAPIEVTFLDGNMNRLVSIPILNASPLQMNKAFGISLSLKADAPAGAATGALSAAAVTILSPIPVIGAWPAAGSITYGQTLAASMLSGGAASVAGSFSFRAPATIPGVGANAATLIFTPADPTDYLAVNGPSVNVTVAKAPLTVAGVKANDKVYDGGANATLNLSGAVLVGVVGGNSVSLSTASAVGLFADKTVANGKTVTVSGLSLSGTDAGNYLLTQPTTTANITPASLQVRADNQTRFIGRTMPVWTVTYSGFVGGDTESSLGGNLTFRFTDMNGVSVPSINTDTPAGTYVIIPNGLTSTDYTLTYFSATLQMNNTFLTVAANRVAKAFGATNPPLSATITGFLNGDGANAFSGSPQLSTSAGVLSPPGVYDVVVGLGTLNSATYGFLLTNGTLTVLPATPVITWAEPAPITYGTALSSAQLNATASVPGTVVYNAFPGTILRVGTNTLSVVFSPNDTTDYGSVTASVTQVVLPAPLTITASNATRFYGAANPAFAGAISGIKNGDAISATYSCDAGATAAPGAYAIVPTLVIPSNLQKDYAVTLVNGALTVLPAAPAIVWANPAPITYGVALSSIQLNATASLPGTSVYNPPAGSALPVGTNALSVVFSPTDATDYTSLTTRVTQVVLPAPLSIAATNARRPYGQTNPVLTGTITGLLQQDAISATYATAAQINSPAGIYPIVPNVVDPHGLAANYSVSRTNGSLTVTAALLIDAAPETVVVGQGTALLDSTASVADGGSLNFGGGTLTVVVATNAAAGDLLGIESPGTNSGRIGLAGHTVTWGGADLATFDGGVGTNALKFSLTTNATSVSLTALLQQVNFASSDTNGGARVVAVTLAYGDVTVAANRPFLLDRPPVASVADIWVIAAAAITIPTSEVLSYDMDPDGDPLSVLSCSPSSALGGQMSVDSAEFIYHPPSLTVQEDVLSYVVADGKGGETDATVKVHLVPNGQLRLNMVQSGAVGVQLTVAGTPGQPYQIQASVDLLHWTVLQTVTASPSGVIEILDATARNYPNRFYRVVPQ